MKAIYKILAAYNTNAFLYNLKTNPTTNFFFNGNLIYEENFRKYMTIPFNIMKYIIKTIICILLLYFPFLISREANYPNILTYFIFFSFTISLLNPLIKFDSLTNVFINHFHINANYYCKTKIKIHFIENIISLLLGIYILHYYTQIPYIQTLLFIPIYLSSQTIALYFNLKKKTKKLYIPNKLIHTLLILMTLSILSTIYLIINLKIKTFTTIIIYITWLLIGLFLYLELLYEINFIYLSKKYLQKEYIELEEKKLNDITTSINTIQNLNFKKTITSEKTGIEYLQDLFHQRFRSEIKGRENYIRNLLIILTIASLILLIFKQTYSNFNDINSTYLILVSLIMLTNSTFSYLKLNNKEIDSKLYQYYWFNKKEIINNFFNTRMKYINKTANKNLSFFILFSIVFYIATIVPFSYIELSHIILTIFITNYSINKILPIIYYQFHLYTYDYKKRNSINNIVNIFIIGIMEIISIFIPIYLIKFLLLLIIYILIHLYSKNYERSLEK